MLVVVFISYIWLYTTQKYNRLYEQKATEDYREKAKYYFDNRCRAEFLSRDEIISCFYESISTAREAERAEQDLQAQREMAEWAAYMWGATFVGLFIGLGGTIAVALNLKQTNKALSIAQKGNELAEAALEQAQRVSKRELRAYLSVDDCTHAMPVIGENIRCNISIKNCGQTPAYRVEFRGYATVGSKSYAQTVSLHHLNESPATSIGVLGPGQIFTIPMSTNSKVRDRTIELIKAETSAIHFYGVVMYRDTFNDPQHMEFWHSASGEGALRGGAMGIYPTGNGAT